MPFCAAIVEDSAADAEYVENILRRWADARDCAVSVERFPSAENFLFRYAEDKAWDVLLLDIEMGAMDGVSLAKQIRKDNDAVQIVFVTGYPDHMAQGYDVAALHYLMKPVREGQLFAVLDRAAGALQKQERFLLLPVEGETVRLAARAVRYAESFSHTVELATEKGTYSVKLSMGELEKQLGEGFVRCHRSYLVNLAHISRLSKTEVILDGGKRLPLSRGAARQVHRAFVRYYTGDSHEAF